MFRCAADLPTVTKSGFLDRGEFTVFVEGGAFQTGGGQIPFFGGFAAFTTLFGGAFPAGSIPNVNPGWGWDIAAGADYRFAGTPWHVNTQFRYGQTNKLDSGSTSVFASTFNLSFPGFAINALAATTPTLEEKHWQADFGAGFDFMRGAQVNFGFRVAEIRSDLTASTAFALTASGGISANASVVEADKRSFLGAGPRIGLDGSVPIWGPLSFDYAGDAAILFGNTKLATGEVFGFGITAPGFALGATGIPVNQRSWSSPNTVYNFDVQAGFSYWFTPHMRLGISYRLDAFIDALRTAPDDGSLTAAIGPGRSIDRFYHGPKATLAAKF